jgi:hypothetical protein
MIAGIVFGRHRTRSRGVIARGPAWKRYLLWGPLLHLHDALWSALCGLVWYPVWIILCVLPRAMRVRALWQALRRSVMSLCDAD